MNFDPPSLFRDVVFISDNPGLTATASSAVGNSNEYVTVLRNPRTFDRRVFEGDIARHSNAIARVNPRLIMLLDVEQKTVDAVASRFRGTKIEVAVCSTKEEAAEKLRSLYRATLSGVLHCRLQDVGIGLLEAKRKSRLLIVDDSSSPLTSSSPQSKHLVAIDDESPINHVIAANYAFSIEADLSLLPLQEDDLRERVYSAADARSTNVEEPRGIRANVTLATVTKELSPSLDFGPREFVTFITKGLPYGYFYHDAPSTHLISSLIDRHIVTSIFASTFEPIDISTMLIDPGHFGESETNTVGNILKNEGMLCACLRDNAATVNNARVAISCYPYDLLFICCHCGEIKGHETLMRVPDKEGELHEVKFHTIYNIGSNVQNHDGVEKVLFTELFRPVSMDGIDWFDLPAELRVHIPAVFEYIGKRTDRSDIIDEKPINRVAHSTALPMWKNQPLLLNTMQNLDAASTAVIFNNSCMSFYDAAQTFIYAGARTYIGTLASVQDADAQNIAIAFMQSEELNFSLALALHKVQVQHWNNPLDRIYVHVGCHFNRLRPRGAAFPEVRRRLRESIARWSRYAGVAEDPGKMHAQEAVKFLKAQLAAMIKLSSAPRKKA